MASFTLDGISYEYLRRAPGPHANIQSWEYGSYPNIMATVPLADGFTVDVYALASRWNPTHILVAWQDDEYHPHGETGSLGSCRPETNASEEAPLAGVTSSRLLLT